MIFARRLNKRMVIYLLSKCASVLACNRPFGMGPYMVGVQGSASLIFFSVFLAGCQKKSNKIQKGARDPLRSTPRRSILDVVLSSWRKSLSKMPPVKYKGWASRSDAH